MRLGRLIAEVSESPIGDAIRTSSAFCDHPGRDDSGHLFLSDFSDTGAFPDAASAR